MQILVTGGAGFIGSNFVEYILNKYPDYKVVVLDALTYCGRLENFSKSVQNNKNFKFIKGDVRNFNEVQKAMKNCLAVVHFAAETHVDRSILNAANFLTTDIYGTYICLEVAKKYKIKKFLHISTDEVYGEANKKPCTEISPLFPKSPYAAAKTGADRLAWSYFATYKLPVVITRCTNNYGPKQYPEKMIPLFITNCLENKKMPIYGTGKNTRDWVYVLDHCRALDLILHTSNLEGEIFNIGSGEEFSILQVANFILKELNLNQKYIEFIKDRPGHILRHAVNTQKIKKLGWQPKVKFAAGIKQTINWYKENKKWWVSIKNKQKDYKSFSKKWYNKGNFKF